MGTLWLSSTKRLLNTVSGGTVIIEANSFNVVKDTVADAVPGDIVYVSLMGDTPEFSVYNA